MNEEKLREFFRNAIALAPISFHMERWIVHQLLSAVKRETDAKILDELERIAR